MRRLLAALALSGCTVGVVATEPVIPIESCYTINYRHTYCDGIGVWVPGGWYYDGGHWRWHTPRYYRRHDRRPDVRPHHPYRHRHR